MECPKEEGTTTISRIVCILTYGGSTKHMAINYTLLVANFGWCLHTLFFRPPRSNYRPLRDVTRKNMWLNLGSFAFVWVFQVDLCLILGCSGISIVWCSLAGWVWYEQRKFGSYRRQRHQSTYLLSDTILFGLNGAALTYYLVTEEMITTVAHGCALALGVLLSWLV